MDAAARPRRAQRKRRCVRSSGHGQQIVIESGERKLVAGGAVGGTRGERENYAESEIKVEYYQNGRTPTHQAAPSRVSRQPSPYTDIAQHPARRARSGVRAQRMGGGLFNPTHLQTHVHKTAVVSWVLYMLNVVALLIEMVRFTWLLLVVELSWKLVLAITSVCAVELRNLTGGVTMHAKTVYILYNPPQVRRTSTAKADYSYS